MSSGLNKTCPSGSTALQARNHLRFPIAQKARPLPLLQPLSFSYPVNCVMRTPTGHPSLPLGKVRAIKCKSCSATPLPALYYAGGNTYASDPAHAVDFRDIGCATQFALQNHFLSAGVILNYLDPPCQITLPLHP